MFTSRMDMGLIEHEPSLKKIWVHKPDSKGCPNLLSPSPESGRSCSDDQGSEATGTKAQMMGDKEEGKNDRGFGKERRLEIDKLFEDAWTNGRNEGRQNFEVVSMLEI